MANYNRVILAGNLTRDPELSYTPNNTAVCRFGLAINRRWRDQDGNPKEEVCYVDVTAFGRQGETINQYLTKGRPILVEGRLRYRQWTTPEGQNRSGLSVVAEGFQFLGPPGASGRGPGPGPAPAASRPAPPQGEQAPQIEDEPPAEDADVPF